VRFLAVAARQLPLDVSFVNYTRDMNDSPTIPASGERPLVSLIIPMLNERARQCWQFVALAKQRLVKFPAGIALLAVL